MAGPAGRRGRGRVVPAAPIGLIGRDSVRTQQSGLGRDASAPVTGHRSHGRERRSSASGAPRRRVCRPSAPWAVGSGPAAAQSPPRSVAAAVPHSPGSERQAGRHRASARTRAPGPPTQGSQGRGALAGGRATRGGRQASGRAGGRAEAAGRRAGGEARGEGDSRAREDDEQSARPGARIGIRVGLRQPLQGLQVPGPGRGGRRRCARPRPRRRACRRSATRGRSGGGIRTPGCDRPGPRPTTGRVRAGGADGERRGPTVTTRWTGSPPYRRGPSGGTSTRHSPPAPARGMRSPHSTARAATESGSARPSSRAPTSEFPCRTRPSRLSRPPHPSLPPRPSLPLARPRSGADSAHSADRRSPERMS